VILCEPGGSKTFEDSIRYSMDISSIPVVKQWSHLPVIVDSESCGGEAGFWLGPLALAGMAAGAHGFDYRGVTIVPPARRCVMGRRRWLPETF